MKRITFLIFFLMVLGFLLLCPQTAFTYAKTGLMLWFYTLLPSLLPFLILSSLLLKTRYMDRFIHVSEALWQKIFSLSPQGAYALFLGIFCGYPMGAKITADLYREQRISKKEASYLLTFANHPGPAFLSAFLCVGIFQKPELVFPTYGIIYTSSFLCSLCTRHFFHSHTNLADNIPHKKEISMPHNFGEILDISIMNAFETITRLGGYIILFSILQGIFSQILPASSRIQYLLPCLIEVSTGLSALSASPWPFSILYPLALGFTAFGGLCVAAQTKSMLAHTDLSLKPYLLGKLCCSVCTFLLAHFLIKIIKIIV